MITASQIYWLMKLDDIHEFCKDNSGLFIASFFAVVWLLVTVGFRIANNKSSKPSHSYWLIGKKMTVPSVLLSLFFVISFIVFSLAYTFLPTTKQMAVIIVVPKIVNAAAADTNLTKLPAQITSLASEWLEQLKPSKEDLSKVVKDVKNTKISKIPISNKDIKNIIDTLKYETIKTGTKNLKDAIK